MEMLRSNSGDAMSGRAMSVADIEAQLLSGASASAAAAAPQAPMQFPQQPQGMHGNNNDHGVQNNGNILGMPGPGMMPGMNMQQFHQQQQQMAARQMNVPPLLQQQMQVAHMHALMRRQQQFAQNFTQVCTLLRTCVDAYVCICIHVKCCSHIMHTYIKCTHTQPFSVIMQEQASERFQRPHHA
jgi:hypothetical protein